jgi:hypothetical protein
MAVLKVIDYQTSTNLQTDYYNIVPGNIDVMKASDLAVLGENSLTKAVVEGFFNGRYYKIINIVPLENANLSDFRVHGEIHEAIQEILDRYVSQDYLIVSSLPSLLYEENSKSAEAICRLLRFSGFKDIADKTEYGKYPEYNMFYMNNMGTLLANKANGLI